MILSRNRLDMIARHLSQITIGSVSMPVSQYTELVPMQYLKPSQSVLQHLQWMMKKDSLGQDIFLLGPPGPFKRRLAFTYLALTQQELEYVAIHPDISAESDLKQRREIVVNRNGQELKWVDGSCVNAAIHGRVLVIEGIEKAERNVLPVLNNLLENREMTLEDGRHIIGAGKYDQLLLTQSKEQLDRLGLIRAHERFRVIAIGSPVPPYPGKPLDPPFRSRFQVRYVDVSFRDYKNKFLQNLSNVISSVRIGQNIDSPMLNADSIVPSFHQSTMDYIEEYLTLFPLEKNSHILQLISSYWPSSWIKKEKSSFHERAFKNLLDKFEIFYSDTLQPSKTSYQFSHIDGTDLVFNHLSAGTHTVRTQVGTSSIKMYFPFIETRRCNDLLSRMMQTHAINQDMLLVGPSSSSKTTCINKFADLLAYEITTIYLYRDLTARDLLQRRKTRNDGSTYWEDSAMVDAARNGKLVVLEGIHWISAEVLSAISRLLQDREISLPDGSQLISAKHYDKLKKTYTTEQLRKKRIHPIHPSFRVLGTANISKSDSMDWFNEEISGLFRFLQVDPMTIAEERELIQKQSKCNEKTLDKVLQFAFKFRELSNTDGHESVLTRSINLSTRQLLRICKRAAYPQSNLYYLIHAACLSPFLPCMARMALDDLLKEVGIHPISLPELNIVENVHSVTFGDVEIAKFQISKEEPEAISLIPHTSKSNMNLFSRNTAFFDNANQSRIMRDLALDFTLGEHLLLIGNQGVGKNKLIDRFLELLQYPREYVQLHRDTTVQSLLVQTSLEDGKIVYKDSPLLKAVRNGRVLIVDEADKAPIYITSILKSLCETGEMDISDGRRIRSGHISKEGDIIIHPQFRMVVLANRPGFPFLGNDFYGAIGDVFGTYSIGNPDFSSEVTLLSQIAPSVPTDIIKSLVSAFNDLRKAFDDGMINYPYSLRELIHIVRHLERYPLEEIESVLRNVVDFDLHTKPLMEYLVETFNKHGIPMKKSDFSIQHDLNESLFIKYSEKVPPAVSVPKKGKVDENKHPHVGGNTWFGGTGGSDTAGLGGRGGPYRMDNGNQIHQLSDVVLYYVGFEESSTTRGARRS
jgi:von Willebrand factor A domain-containing protein 8